MMAGNSQTEVFKLYALGSNGSGQLGLGHTDDQSSPREVSLPLRLQHTRIANLTAGGNHTIILSASGDQAWGCGSPIPAWSQTHSMAPETTPESLSEIVFEPISSPSDTSAPPVTHTAAIWEGTCYATSWKFVSTGTSSKGELGAQVPNAHSDVQSWNTAGPIQMPIRDLAAGMYHMAAVDRSGKVWGWGNNTKGQLGKSVSKTGVPPSLMTEFAFEIDRVICGKDFTCVASSPEDGTVKVLGSDRFGVVSACPSSIQGYKDIRASWGSIYVLFNDGRLISWGRNDHGQLCPPNLPLIESFAAGSEHVVAITCDGQVITWGWGEHGNCGESLDEQHDVKGRFNTLPLPAGEKPHFVGAGCATTFIGTVKVP